MLRPSVLAILLGIGGLNANAQDAVNPYTSTVETAVTGASTETNVIVPEAISSEAVPIDAPADSPIETPTEEAVVEPLPDTGPIFTLEDALASGERARTAEPGQEKCITIMNGFPNTGHEARYQFFKLTQAVSEDVDPTMRSAIDFFGDSNVTPQTPVVEVIENIANPVYRQAAPEITIGNMGYLIDFALDCDSYLSGQIASLEAFDSNLDQAEFHVVIGEDALFMRQILSDSLYRLGGQEHEIFGPTVLAYSDQLVRARNFIEYASFENQLETLEAVYLTDLDGRLARSNDVINNEIDRESLARALEITNDLNEQARLESKRKQLQTLARILGGGR